MVIIDSRHTCIRRLIVGAKTAKATALGVGAETPEATAERHYLVGSEVFVDNDERAFD